MISTVAVYEAAVRVSLAPAPPGNDIAIVTTDLEATASPTKHGYGSEVVHVARVVWMANWQPEVDGLPALAVAEIERMDDGRGRAARVVIRGPSVPRTVQARHDAEDAC